MRSLVAFLSILGVVLAPVRSLAADGPSATAISALDAAAIRADLDQQRRELDALRVKVDTALRALPAAQPKPRPSLFSARAMLAMLSVRSPLAAAALGAPLMAAPSTVLAYPGVGGGGSTPAAGSGGLPSGCVDNSIARADGTAGATQCSVLTIADTTGNIGSSVNALTIAESAGTAGSHIILNEAAGAGLFYGASNGIRVDGDTATLLGALALRFEDANVAIAESGTNDLALTADGGVELTITGTLSTFGGAVTAAGDITASSGDFQLATGESIKTSFDAGNRITFAHDARLVLSPPSTFGVDLSTAGSKVACDSTNAGSLFYENTASDSVVAKLFLCGEKADNTFAWGEVTIVFP